MEKNHFIYATLQQHHLQQPTFYEMSPEFHIKSITHSKTATYTQEAWQAKQTHSMNLNNGTIQHQPLHLGSLNNAKKLRQKNKISQAKLFALYQNWQQQPTSFNTSDFAHHLLSLMINPVQAWFTALLCLLLGLIWLRAFHPYSIVPRAR